MATNDDVKWLYGKLKAKGYDIGSEEEFSHSLSNEDDRKWYYEKATGMGLDVGSNMDEFDEIFATAKKPSINSLSPDDMERLSKIGKHGMNEFLSLPERGQQQWTPVGERKLPSDAADEYEKVKGNGPAMVDMAERLMDRNRRSMQSYRDQVAGINQSVGKSDTTYAGKKFNPATKKIEDVYLTPGGKKFGNKAEADMESFNYRQNQQRMREEEQRKREEQLKLEHSPSLGETIGKSIGSGFLRAGAGLLDALQALSSGMIVEDPSSPTGYTRMRAYDESLLDRSDPLTYATSVIHKKADSWSEESQPYSGRKGFLDLLWDGEIGNFLQKGVATAGESLPMTLSAFNPYTMTLNAISMSGSNYRENTLSNPDIPAWKRASQAIGSAAIEQAVEKYSDPVFKYFGGLKLLKGSAKDLSGSIVSDVTHEATESLSRRIYGMLKGLGKDAVGEGVEEIVSAAGNDVLGETLDLVDGKQDYGLRAQWEDFKQKNKDADLMDFSRTKAKEYVESFIGGALAGAYTSGTAQVSGKALQYVFDRTGVGAVEADAGVPLSPLDVDIAQSFDDGYTEDESQSMNEAKNLYELRKERLSVMVGVSSEELDDVIGNPLGFIEEMERSGRTGYTDVVLDYINAKAKYDGMMQRVRDDIDGQIEQSNALVDSRINKSTGMIQGATMKQNDRKVYIISGNVVPYEDGTGIDVSRSGSSIIVRDAETGAFEQISPEAILSIEEEQDPQEQKQIASETIRQQFATDAANKIDGVVGFNPGDTYTIVGDEGQQVQIRVVANEQGIVDNGDGTVNVTNGTQIFPFQKDVIQQNIDAQNAARVYDSENQRMHENIAANQTAREESRPHYTFNDQVTLRDAAGNVIHGQIADHNEADDTFVVDVDNPINGQYAPNLTREQLDGMVVEYNGHTVKKPSVVFQQNVVEAPVQEQVQEPASEVEQEELQHPSAIERIPKDEQGQPVYEQADSDTAYDAIVEESGGDVELADEVINDILAEKKSVVKSAEKALQKLLEAKPSLQNGPLSVRERIAAKTAAKEAQAQAQADVYQARMEQSAWERIANTPQRRRMAAEEARLLQLQEVAAAQQEEEERKRAAQAEAERLERESLMGVPDVVDDTAADARARGFRRVNGNKVERQAPLDAQRGKDVIIKFSEGVLQPGTVAIIDASQLQPSHISGHRNPVHFLDEAQPKERKDTASIMAVDRIAGNIRPEEITSSVTAFTGAPTVNSRGEVIQGNNRSAALRTMWDSYPEQASAYRQYLMDHAEEFGLNAEDISYMEHPVLVNMLDVADGDAIVLGQYVAQDTESGGVERIQPKNVLQKMGNDISKFTQRLLASTDDDVSLSALIDRNGGDVLRWMSARKFISNTQYQSAFDSRGNLTAEAKNDLQGILYQSIFAGGGTQLEEMFSQLPARAQKAILSTAYRDSHSMQSDRMLPELQQSIRAYYALMQDPQFAEAKNFKDARIAVEDWKRQYQMDDVTGESYLPADNFSNFALHLASMYKVETQGLIQNTLNHIYDLVQGTQEVTFFETPDNTPRTLSQAIFETLNIPNDGQLRSDVLAGNRAAGQKRRQGSDGIAQARERVEDGEQSSDSTGGTESGSGQSEVVPEEESENVLSERVQVDDDDWTEGSGKTPTYKRSVLIDGKYRVTQVDEPNSKGDYDGSYFEYDGKRFSSIPEVIEYIDNNPTIGEKIESQEQQVNTNPSDAQKEAGNYKKGHIQVGSFNVTIEQPKGSVRRGTDEKGNSWETTMQNTYGYIRGTEGVDGDHIDVFLSNDIDGWNGRRVFVVDQYNEDGIFDEHKVMMGFNSQEEAQDAYFSNYDKDWADKRKIVVTSVNLEDFEKWIQSSHRKTKPFAEYKSLNTEETVVVSNSETTTPANDYTIEPTPSPKPDGYNVERRYHKKNGKYIIAVKFTNQMPREQFLDLKKRVKDFGGYYSSFGKGGFIFDNEADANKFAQAVLDPSGEALDDNTPLTLSDMRKASEQVNTPDMVEEPAKQEQPSPQSENRLVSDHRYEELKKRMRAKLGQINIGIDPEIIAIGAEMAVYHIERGARKFADYSKSMIADLGDVIRPYLKSFYNAVRDMPEAVESGFVDEMTSYEEVSTFDIANFDKDHTDPFATAENTVAEQEIVRQAEEAKKEIISKRNTERRKENEQTTADTEAIAGQAEAIASQAESDIEAATDERQINEIAANIDTQIEKVNEQLALLGYYEAEFDDKDFNEAYGYMRNAEKKAVKDANSLAKRLVKDLGITPELLVDNKGKRIKNFARANIAPAGGDVTITLPLMNGRELKVYISLEPTSAERGEDYIHSRRGDNLYIEHIMYRVENPEASGYERYGNNQWIRTDADYEYMLRLLKYEARDFLPKVEAHESNIGKTARSNEPKSFNGYKVGDKVLYTPSQRSGKPVDAVIHDFENEGEHRPVLDTGLAPILYEVVDWGDIKPVTQKETTEKPSKTRKKPVSSQKKIADLFGGLFDNEILTEKEEEHGLQRNDEVRSERLSADNDRHKERLSDGTGSGSEIQTEESRGIDTGRERGSDEVDRTVRPRSSGSVVTPKNTRNNHSERGENHAPSSVDARIDANIKAIELENQLIENGETATPEQMAILRKFSGWGGLGKAFNDANISQRLQEILGAEGYNQAVMSANSAYYTPAYVVDTLWDIAEQMGFEGGSILEGSAGIGNIIGQMPTSISQRSDIHAVEIDQTSGNILSLLYPDAKVDIQGFEKTRIQNGSVDLAITNVPFVTGLRVDDTTGDRDLSKKFHNIHDFCIAKNVRKLREGGIGIFISSNGTLDNSKKLRDWIVNEAGADFVGAFRMNNATFGGTSVTSDIIVIRKRVNGKKSPNAIDVSTSAGERTAEYDTGDKRKVKGVEVPVVKQLAMDYNQYFIEHPDHMAGNMRFAFEEGDTFRPTSKGLYPASDKNQQKMLAKFVAEFSGKDWQDESTEGSTTESNVNQFVEDVSSDGKKVGELYVKDGKLVIASLGGYYQLNINANKVKGHTKVECFNAYAEIKQALADVLEYQTNNEHDDDLQPLLDKLNKAYDDFVATYGHFNKNTSISFLRNDVDFPNVFSLEKYDETADSKGNRIQNFGKTDVFKTRVVEKDKEPTPTNVKDGIIASVFKFGRIDLPYIAGHLGENVDDIRKDIIENGYGFENPVTRQIEVSFQYLSGNVREKLRQAQENNENGIYDRNIKALQAVLPMDIPAHLIDFTLGSSWIDPKLYDEYVKERTDVEVQFTSAGGTWFMKAPSYGLNMEKNRSMGVVSEQLRKTIYGHTLIEAAIQNKSITVSQTYRKWDGTTETVVDREATQACAAKIDEIRQDFKDWARQKMQSDSNMSADIERIYNDMFNNYVPMTIPEEFIPEYFGGASHRFKMRPHQGKAIVRGTMQPLMLAHEVGTGKTFTLISTAMEMRRLGTARKPMIVVQNATVGQFVASAKELYPNAKILTLEESDRSAEGRKNFYAKIRYNDWDMIVVPQSTFEFIPDSDERQMAFIQDKIEEKKMVLEQMKEADPDGSSMITRQAEKEIEQLEGQLAEITDESTKKRSASDQKKRAVSLQNAEVRAKEMLDRRTDDVENFDDMGIDALLVDEAHEYKHLGFATAMQRGVKGVDPSYSKKSQGVYLKTQAVLEKNNGRNVIFATGTPISNTAAEIWTFMRYLMPADTMKEYGIYYFDDFVRNFGNIQQMLEFTTSGKFKENNRFAGYVNLPELVRIWSGVSDTVLTREAGGVSDKIPDMETGKAQDIYLPQTRALRGIMKFVKSQLDKFEKMSGKEKKENSHIPLTMYGIAKAAAVDARLVSKDAEDDPNSKTNEAVRQTLRSLNETEDYKGTVALFADNYQNKYSGFNLYDDIREKLIAEGVPAEQIVVMRSGMTIKKKLEIFDKVNKGEIRVILGSTFTLGTGVNIQERLHTLIHIDAPNRPMDYTQRNGRILRQGNIHKAMGKPVRVLRFGVEDSLDVTAYQRLKTKGAIADSIMDGKKMMANSMANRVLEEDEDVFGDTVAQLSGSEYALLKNNAEKNVRKYESRKKQWEVDQTYIHNAKPKLKAQIENAERIAKEQKKYLSDVKKAFPDGRFTEIRAGKHTFESVNAMSDFIKEHNKAISEATKKIKEGGNASLQTRNLTISFGDYTFNVQTVLNVDTVQYGGQLFPEVHRKMTYTCPELGLNNIPVHQGLLRNAIEDIVSNVITGKDFEERAESAERSAAHNRSELELLEAREGKPFEFDKELADARKQYMEYSEAMKKEMAEKEAKYAEMDAAVDIVSNVDVNEDEDEVLYRSDDVTKDRVESLFNEAISGEFKGKPIPIGTLTNEGKAFLEQISGVDFKDKVDFVLNPSDLIHIYKRHFGENEKDGRNIPLDIDDIRSIVDILSKPDRVIYSVEDGRQGRKMFSFLKEAEQGTYNLLEIYSDKRGNLTAKSFYKSKEGVSQRAISLTRTLHSTSETDGATLNDIANIPQMFDTSILEDENLREGDGALTDDELSYVNDPVAKMPGNPRRTRSQRKAFSERERKRMVKRVQELAENLHLDNVDIITDASILEGNRSKAKGFFNKRTGKITIVIPNHVNTFDVEQTLLHEAVSHYGLRQLFGEHFDTFLDNVYQNADEKIRRKIFELATNHGWNFRTATEEYLASLAERTNFENMDHSWWMNIKELFLRMLHQIGFEGFSGVTLTDNELRYILWRSYENLAEPGRYRSILGEAADVAKQYELRVGNYADNTQDNQEVAELSDDLYRNGDPEVHERALARYRYEQRVRSGMFQTQEALQDSMLGLREAMQAILGRGKNIEDVDGFENAYLGENRLSSVNKAEADAFARLLFKPMLDEVARLAPTKEAREELTDYLMAKHGLERNELMRRREKEKLIEERMAKDKPQPPSENDDDLDMKMATYEKAMEEWENQVEIELGDELDAIDNRDFAGITSLTANEDVAAAEADAQQMVDDYEAEHETEDLWDSINAVSKAILQKSYECGMMNRETFEHISNMYAYYIPLRGFDEKTSNEAYAYLTHKQSAFNAPIKKAKGRTSKADDPFANLQSMAESAIMQGNRNKLVKQRFLNFTLNHPSDLVSISDLWVQYDDVVDEWKPVFPDNIEIDDTPDEVEQKMLDFEDKMKQLAESNPDMYKRGKDAVNIPYRVIDSRDLRQHQVVVRRGGRDYVITINANPRAAQALNGQTNPDNDTSGVIGAILRVGEKLNRQLSAFYTTRNPDFVVSNFLRDLLYTNIMTWVKENPSYALRFHRNYMKVNPVQMKRLLAKLRKGTLDMSHPLEAMFHQFIMNGGETGYANIRDIEQHKNDIRKELKKANGKLNIRKAFSLLSERLDELNRAVENCARFAAFITSREMGRSLDRAIYDAKEISVNFNKKGSGAKFYDTTGQTKSGNVAAFTSGIGRSGYVFWNAAIQGTTNFGRQLKRNPAKAYSSAAVMFLLGALVAYLGGDDDDDDDKNSYYNLPEYVRRSNILFRVGESWISIPLPVEYRALYGMGELMTSTLNGKEHYTGVEIAEQVAAQVSQILPLDLMNDGGLMGLVPSSIKPFAEVHENKSWTGLPIYKDTPWNKNMPEWTKAYKSANRELVNLAAALNEISGGDRYTKGLIDINPANVEHLLEGYFGGVASTIDKMTKTAETIAGTREYDPRSLLLVNRVIKAGDERTEYRAVNNEYFRLKEEHDRIGERLRHYENDTDNDIFDYAEKIDFLYNSPEYERWEIFEFYKDDIDYLYEELKEPLNDDERREVEDELNEVKKEMIQKMNLTRNRK